MITAAHADHPQLSIRQLCALVGVSRSGYYNQPDPADRSTAVALRAAIEDLVLAFPGYGYRRVTRQLQRDGWTVNHKRVLRIMREESLLCQLKRRFVVTTDARHAGRRYPNLIASLAPQRPDQIWQADITYIRLPTGFVYLACVLDGYSRRCVGWALSRSIDTQLALAALELALTSRQPVPGLIHHSDQGVQYASATYVARLEQAGVRSSMAGSGNPYENAKAESFFKTLKTEEVYLKEYRTYQDAHEQLQHFIEEVYNRKRLHSSLGYRPPVEFEAHTTMAAD
jgi:putative transposase